MNIVDYLEVGLSLPLKAVVSDPISRGVSESQAFVLSGILVGEIGGFGGGSRELGAC